MSQTVRAIFDGQVFRPENPIDLEPDKRYIIKIEAEVVSLEPSNEVPLEINGEEIYLNPNSAEAKAVKRIESIDFADSSQWITEGQIGEEIDVDAINQRLKERGYKIQVSFTDSQASQ